MGDDREPRTRCPLAEQPQEIDCERVAERGERHCRDDCAGRRPDCREDCDNQHDGLDDADSLAAAARGQRPFQPRPQPAACEEQIPRQSRAQDPIRGLSESPHEDRKDHDQQRVDFHIESRPEFARHAAPACQPAVHSVQDRRQHTGRRHRTSDERNDGFANQGSGECDEHGARGGDLVGWPEACERMSTQEADCATRDASE